RQEGLNMNLAVRHLGIGIVEERVRPADFDDAYPRYEVAPVALAGVARVGGQHSVNQETVMVGSRIERRSRVGPETRVRALRERRQDTRPDAHVAEEAHFGGGRLIDRERD